MKYDGTSLVAESTSPLAQCTDLSSTPGGRAEPVSHGREILSVVGYAELTAANSNRFRKEVCAVLNEHKVVEIDLSQTTTMDCAGLGALIALRNLALARKGVVRLVNPTSRLTQLLDLMRAGEIFEIVNTRLTNDK
jgi:anti-anti-sigma factor